jgi:hypothetical protein
LNQVIGKRFLIVHKFIWNGDLISLKNGLQALQEAKEFVLLRSLEHIEKKCDQSEKGQASVSSKTVLCLSMRTMKSLKISRELIFSKRPSYAVTMAVSISHLSVQNNYHNYSHDSINFLTEVYAWNYVGN